MKIAVLSDIHDHIPNFEKAIQLIKQEDCQAVIYCGDFCAPFTAEKFNLINLPIYSCLGNNDEDQLGISEKLKSKGSKVWSLSKEYAEIELDGKKIAFTHYPKLGLLLAQTGDYQAVFHGHTHQAYREHVDQTLLANPGPVCGLIGGQPTPPSFGIYNTLDNSFTVLSI